MISVLVADDEINIREGIQKSIPWTELGLYSVGTAKNGDVAWSQIKNLQPEIVILDINMPGMNGLDIAEHIRNENLGSQIIFLTGYDDFPKLKKAIELKATDYLLKPVVLKDLHNALEKAKNQIKEIRSTQEYIKNIKGKLKENSEITTNKILIDFLYQQRSYTETIEKLLDLNVHFQMRKSFTVICVEMDEFEFLLEKWNIKDRNLYIFAYRKIVQEILELFGDGLIISEYPGKLTLIVSCEYSATDPRSIYVYANISEEVQKKCAKFLGLSISIGVSNIRENPEEIHESYQEAIFALNYKSIVGPKSIHYYQLIHPSSDSMIKTIGKELFLLNELKVGNEGMVKEILNKFIIELKKYKINEAKIISSQLLIFAIRIISNKGIEEKKLKIADPLSKIYRAETNSQIIDIVTNCMSNFTDIFKQQEKIKNPKIIEEAKKWIKNHLSEDINLNSLASHLHMSPNYLSSLFKQATGETYIEYTTKSRMKVAKKLLLDPEVKISSVARQVGFNDSNYFSIAFKKSEGMTPTQYRARYL